ncbi:MAG: hypothetical protein ACREK2_05945 [Gemmatimonadota bacterium]
MPGRKGYVAAAVVLVAGLVAAGTFLFLRLRDLGAGLHQVVVPGVAELSLEETGRYTIFHETGATVDGRYYASEEVSGLAVSVTDPDGRQVEVHAPGATTSYEFGGREGRSILAFEVDRPGTYLLSGEYPGGSGSEVVLGVAHGFGRRLALTIAGTLALAFGAAGVAVALAALTFLRRYRAGRRPVTAESAES